MLFHVQQNLGVLHWISLVKWECVWDSTSTGHFVGQTEGCALVTSTCHTFFKSPFIWNVGCHVIRHVIIDAHVIYCYTFLLSSSRGFHQRHTYPYWSDASLEAPVSSGGSPAHSIGGVLGQCWNRVKAVLPNLTLKRCQVQQPSLARILANGFGITKFVKKSLNIWEACGLRAGWWEDGLLREGEGGKIPSPEASLVLSPLTTGGSAHFAQSTVNWVNCLSQLQL